MRILALDLRRFGLFTDVTLELATPGRNFQVIYGSNEAGKSTALRALTSALFGIPERTCDGYLHDLPDLRVGVRLTNGAGQELHIVRRKGRKSTILDEDGNALGDGVLEPYLGGVELPVFEAMFGLSHDGLVQGGKDLLAGKGELGPLLFGSGAGIASLQRIRQGLRQEADSLFRPNAQAPSLNEALAAQADAQRRVVELTLTD